MFAGEAASGADEVGVLSARFETLRRTLDHAQRLHAEMKAAPGWSEIESKQWERRMSGALELALEEMRDLSARVAELPARDGEQLRLKARLWLERQVPELDDDVNRLAASICRDILRADGTSSC